MRFWPHSSCQEIPSKNSEGVVFYLRFSLPNGSEIQSCADSKQYSICTGITHPRLNCGENGAVSLLWQRLISRILCNATNDTDVLDYDNIDGSRILVQEGSNNSASVSKDLSTWLNCPSGAPTVNPTMQSTRAPTSGADMYVNIIFFMTSPNWTLLHSLIESRA